MPTKISTEYDQRNSSTEKILPFYCKENPLDVLRKLAPRHHVKGVLKLSTRFSTNYKDNNLYLRGLIIDSSNSEEGLNIVGSLKNFSTKVPPIEEEAKKEIIEGLIKRYLIETEIEDFISYFQKGRFIVSGNPLIKNYFESKKKGIDVHKERTLGIIWEWAKALNEGKFAFGELERIASEYSEHLRTLSAQEIYRIRPSL